MKLKGLKITYAMGRMEGVRDSIEYEIGDLVLLYSIAESYRKLNPRYKYEAEIYKIIEISPSTDGKHFEKYGLENIKTKNKTYWHYPTFLEPAFQPN
jgi:hypothetical protein